MILMQSKVKELVKEGEKRSSADFMTAFNELCERNLQTLIKSHNNGGKKTLTAELVRFTFPPK